MSDPSVIPESAQRLSAFSFDRPIPKAVREFGKAIDPKILEPGDLLLVAHKRQSWRSSIIVQKQSNQFSSEHARWHHAAVCAGGFEICEATFGGVKAHEYWDYMNENFDVRVRRLKGASPHERTRVAYYAAINVKTSYGFGSLLSMARYLSDGNPWSRRLPPSSGVLCSQLYFEACMRAGILLASIPSELACPAHLSITPQMADVELEWLPV